MAVDFNIKATRGSTYEFFPEEIEIRPEMNGRQVKPDIEWLIADILGQGQIQPVGIWSDGGTPVLSYGFSRWRAISEINKRKLTPNSMKLQCVYKKSNEVGAFIRNISENRMRNETTPIDDAHNIQKLFEWTMDEKDVAKIYFPIAATEDEIKEAVKWVQARVNLIRLTPEAEKAMRDGRLSESAAQAIAKLSSTQQRAALKKDGKVTAADVKASAKPAERKKPLKIDTELRRRITAVLETADWENFDENISLRICVQADTLAALKNYIDEK